MEVPKAKGFRWLSKHDAGSKIHDARRRRFNLSVRTEFIEVRTRSVFFNCNADTRATRNGISQSVRFLLLQRRIKRDFARSSSMDRGAPSQVQFDGGKNPVHPELVLSKIEGPVEGCISSGHCLHSHFDRLSVIGF